MQTLSLEDGSERFDAMLLSSAAPTRNVLFAVGGGGDPARHLPLLEALAAHGCRVVAPSFERLVSPRVSGEQLQLRAQRLRRALDAAAAPGLPCVGVGHSIGTTALLALVGAQIWTDPRRPLAIPHDPRLTRLALLTPATDFFRAPGSLAAVQTPLLVWAGTNDTITPAAQAQFLGAELEGKVPVDLRIVADAGHFTFMHVPPPQWLETHPNRETLLRELTTEVCRFVGG